jgi:hypothetical protein
MSRNILRIALAALFFLLAAAWWWSRWPSRSTWHDTPFTQSSSAPSDESPESELLDAPTAERSGRDLAIEGAPPPPLRAKSTQTPLMFVGQVISRANGTPVMDARILVQDEVTAKSFVPRNREERMHPKTEIVYVTELRSDAEGLFEVPLATLKQPRLDVSAPGFSKVVVFPKARAFSQITTDAIRGSVTQSFIESAPANGEGPTIIALDAGAKLHATVARADGTAVQGVTVSVSGRVVGLLRPPGRSRTFNDSNVIEVGSAITDSSGRCTVSDLPTGVDVQIGVHRDDQVLKTWFHAWQFTPNESRELEIQIPSGCRISGRTVDADGAPMPAQEVWLARASVALPHYFSKREEDIVDRTAVRGSGFNFESVSPGAWWIGIVPTADYGDEPRKDALDSRAVYVEVNEGDETKSVELRVHAGRYLRGRVVDPFGNPAKRIPVVARADGVDGSLHARSRDDGTFTIGPVALDRFTVLCPIGKEFAPAPPVTATGDSGEIVLELGLAGRIRGRVLDVRTGAPLDAYVLATSAARDTTPRSSATDSSVNEGFEIVGLPLGSYHVVARTKDGRIGIRRDVEMTHGGGFIECEIGVEPGAKIEVRYLGKHARAAFRASASGAIVGMDVIEPNGIKTFIVPVGASLLERFDGDRVLEELRLELTGGEQRSVEFDDLD